MSAGELAALIQGIIGSRRCRGHNYSSNMPHVPPDNRCCFCLTLRTGTIGIGVGNCVLYLCLFIWYLTSPQETGFRDNISLTNLDISIFVIFCVQILVNTLLVVGAVKRIPSHTFPWLCANAVLVGVCMICIGITVFFGTNKLDLNYSEYVTSLTVLGLVTGVNLFCCIVVFQFRHNTVMERQMQLASQFEGPGCSGPPPSNPPPPSYDEVEQTTKPKAPPLEDGPPEYEAAVAMLAEQGEGKGGPVQRKKSLINNSV